jgi:hypothetical protein
MRRVFYQNLMKVMGEEYHGTGIGLDYRKKSWSAVVAAFRANAG